MRSFYPILNWTDYLYSCKGSSTLYSTELLSFIMKREGAVGNMERYLELNGSAVDASETLPSLNCSNFAVEGTALKW